MKRIYIAVVFLMLWGCANRIAPTGGPKDETPPEMVRSIPENGQRNYKDQEVEIEFNEFINLKNFKEQLIVTPRIDSEYDYKFKKKTVYLEFDEAFSDSTTYTLNFREGIVDITENQPAENLQIAFSTGSLLDTLEILGSVRNMFTHEPIKDAAVGLYPIGDTTDIFTGPPYYFVKTDEEGQYHFRNIKDGNYRIYAFQDPNKNLTCQSATEGFAFKSALIELDTTVYMDTLYMEKMNMDTLELLRVRPSGRYFNVLANKYLINAKLRAANDSILYYHFNDEHDGLLIYNSFDLKDSLQVFVTMEDSLRQITRDTFYLQFPETTRRPNEFKAEINNLEASLESKTIKGEISFTKPIKELRPDSIYIYYDSLTRYDLKNNFSYQIDTINNNLSFTISAPQVILDSIKTRRGVSRDQNISSKGSAARAGKYKLTFPKGTLYSVEEDTTDLLQKDLSFNDPGKTGIISGSITSTNQSYVIQLLDSKYRIIQETGVGKNYKFSNIDPGDYFLRILIDEDENGSWDHSDIRQNREAEPVLFHRDESGNNKTAVRANWEITVDLSF